jgi:hypothetical protein
LQFFDEQVGLDDEDWSVIDGLLVIPSKQSEALLRGRSLLWEISARSVLFFITLSESAFAECTPLPGVRGRLKQARSRDPPTMMWSDYLQLKVIQTHKLNKAIKSS